jgi:hypothetical protein
MDLNKKLDLDNILYKTSPDQIDDKVEQFDCIQEMIDNLHLDDNQIEDNLDQNGLKTHDQYY